MLGVALRLGVTAFGGPAAHIAVFRDEYVDRRGWIGEREFGELVAVSSILPGPSSSQVGIAIGAHRAGLLGGVAAWLGFTLPSAIALTAFGLGIASTDALDAGWVHGLQLVPIPIVALAVIAMRRTLAPDLLRLALAVAAIPLALAGGLWILAALVAGGVVGAVLLRHRIQPVELHLASPVSRRVGVLCGVVLVALLLGLPSLAARSGHAVDLVDAMVRTGTSVVGGGHVVLPILGAATVDPGWVTEEQFLAGYGATQAMPGPLFTFSAYLGAVQAPEPNGVPGATLALVAIFVPAFLLLGVALPFWSAVRRRPSAQAIVAGVSAVVVGVLAAALWDPLVTTAVDSAGDAAFAVLLLVLLLRLPPWVVVLVAAALGAIVY